MPIYDYVCSNCRHVTEVIHGIQEAGPRFCPACGAEGTLTKAFSAPTVHFKGSGWAKKDRSSASASRTKAASASSTSDGKESKGSSDTASAGGADGGDGGASSSSETTTPAIKPAASSED